MNDRLINDPLFDENIDFMATQDELLDELENEPKKIKYIEGNLFAHLQADSNIVVAQVNNTAGIQGAGFARTVRELYPNTDEEYSAYCEFHGLSDPESYFPSTMFTKEDFGYFGNMVVQTGMSGSQCRNATYPDLMRAMEEVRDFCFENGITEIWGPKFGSALCGMEWAFIEELINDIWLSAGLNVTIFVLPKVKKYAK